jgi:hypothetical protein
MEVTILVGIFLLSFAFLIWGFIRREFAPAMIGCILLTVCGFVLYTEGYNSYVVCGPNNSNCSEKVTLNLDVNQNVSSIDTNVTKFNAKNSAFSNAFGLMAGFGGIMILLGVFYLKVNN